MLCYEKKCQRCHAIYQLAVSCWLLAVVCCLLAVSCLFVTENYF